MYAGHFSQSVPALPDAAVTGVTGTISVSAGSNATRATFVQDGNTGFTLAVPDDKAVHELEITAELTAALNVPLPPMLQTTHHPARTDVYTRRVTCRCGDSSTTKTVRIYGFTTRSTCGRCRRNAARSGHSQPARRALSWPRRRLPARSGPWALRADAPIRRAGGARSHPRTAQGGADHGGRLLLVGLSVVGRGKTILLSPAAAMASVAAGTTGSQEGTRCWPPSTRC